jgi:hypothetical protein
MTTTTEQKLTLAKDLRIMEQEGLLSMYGARKIRTNESEVSVGTIDGVEVLVSRTSPILHRIDLETTEGNIYGYDGRPQDLEDFAPPTTWTRFHHYVKITRRWWSPTDGNWMRVTCQDVRFD